MRNTWRSAVTSTVAMGPSNVRKAWIRSPTCRRFRLCCAGADIATRISKVSCTGIGFGFSIQFGVGIMLIDVHSHYWEYPAHFSDDFKMQARRSRGDVEVDLTV